MKWHKFFAWTTVICFLMTIITGYEKNNVGRFYRMTVVL